MMVQDVAMTIAQILLGSAMGESLCEFLIAPAWDWLARRFKIDDEARQIVMRLWSALVGVLIALEYQLDIPGLLGMFPEHIWVGMVFTGLVIGRGSNATHEFLAKWVAQRQEAQAMASLASKSAHTAWTQ